MTLSGPHLQVRIYVPESAFSVDYYWPAAIDESPDFLPRFSRVLANARVNMKGQAEFRTTPPLYFTRCPGCSMWILTNRDPGAKIECQNCKQAFATEPGCSDNLVLRAMLLQVWGDTYGQNSMSSLMTDWLHLL